MKKKEGYTASIRVFGKTYEAKGESVRDAIEHLKLPGVVRAVGILTVSHGSKSKDKVLPANATFRLFSPSKLMREVALKQTALLFDL